MGNIYADEALFRARIHPLRPARRAHAARSASALREASIASLRGRDRRARGASIDDFRHPDGVRGSFQDRFLVHRREGEPCPRCGGDDREVRRRRAGDLRLRALPAAPAGRRRQVRRRRELARGGRRGRRPSSSLKPPSSSSPTMTWGNVIIPVRCDELDASLRVLCQIDLLVRDAALGEQALGARAERARIGGVDDDSAHYFTKYSGWTEPVPARRDMRGSRASPVPSLDSRRCRALKTEAVVLRSMRYGEADRILHLYTPQRGRVGAIAKGVRRARSRFGGRLEPFFRLQLELHEGRSELLTVTGARDGRTRMRGCARTRARSTRAARACDAVARLFETGEPAPGRLQPALPTSSRCSTPSPARAARAERRSRSG